MSQLTMSYIGNSMYGIRPKYSGVIFSPKGEIFGQVKIFRPDGTLKEIIKGKDLEKHKEMMLKNENSKHRYNNNKNPKF